MGRIRIAALICSLALSSSLWADKYAVSVRFHPNGGYGTMSSKKVSADTERASYYTLPSCTFKNPGYYFNGWLVQGACYETDEEAYLVGAKIDLRDYTDSEECSEIILRPVWHEMVSPEDDWLYIKDDGDMWTDIGEEVERRLEDSFYVSSGSAVTITLSSLPTGLKYDKASRKITGKTTKKGVYYVTCSAKNTNGYQMTSMIRWFVGEATEGDYDDIGLPDDFLDYLCVGRLVMGCELPTMTVTGLPTGLKFPGTGCVNGACISCAGEYLQGTPTKAGKFVVKCTEKGTNRKAQKTVIVQDGGSAYLRVNTGYDSEDKGTVTGSGVKRAGASVSISAKAKSGCYFAGWFTDGYCEEPFYDGKSGDYRTANESFYFDALETPEFFAKFVTKAEDADIAIYADDDWYVDTEYGLDYFWFEVESQSKPTVTAKGLPSGFKLSGSNSIIADPSKIKPGMSLVTLTAKNLSGATISRTLRIVVPNLRSWVFDGIDYEEVYTYIAGESDACKMPWGFAVEDGWTVTAGGLPSGIKLNQDKTEGYAYLSGMAKKAGLYTVTLTAKKGSQTEKATFTIEVLPFPTDAVGTYGGVLGYDFSVDEDDDDGIYCVSQVDGTFSLTVANDGKISVKFVRNGKTVSFSGYSCEVSEKEVYFSAFDSRDNWCSLEIFPSVSIGDYQIHGWFGTEGEEWSVLGQRNVAKTDTFMKEMVAKLVKIGKIYGCAEGGSISCPNCIEWYGSPNVTFTASSDGTLRATGKIEGRSISSSAMLQVLERDDDILLYADFYEYKSGSGIITYRAVFSWDWINEPYITGRSALCDGEYSYWGGGGSVVAKPVIYLYPETETICSVKVNFNGKLTYTYPDHGVNGWREFVASPDGTLTFADRSQYYCLFWEGQMPTAWDFSHGYCVKGSETASFLADVLLKMGLSFREANEFIIYWLPQMQDNPYNVIAFQGEKYTKAAKLEISPSPDSLLRIFMAWRPSSKFIDIVTPTIVPFERRGFTVVEWGGTKVN